MKRRTMWLLLGACAVLVLFALCAWALSASVTKVPLTMLEGKEPVKVYWTGTANSATVQADGERTRYEIDRSFDDVVAEIESELHAEDGWARKTVASTSRIYNYYQRLPGDKYNRMTIGVEDGWSVPRADGLPVKTTNLTIAQPTRDVGLVERLGHRLREWFRR